ncbi:hypothetical protein [Roseateles flavus]|uniref:Integrase n=1 Tax=Roseateles flavus TaxID=3149041 RepID=A0ABV0G8X5_9BURK
MALAQPFTIPKLFLTELVEPTDRDAILVNLDTGSESDQYAHRDAAHPGFEEPEEKSVYPFFPLVLCSDGTPWAEATLYLLDRLELDYAPKMSNYSTSASDLAFYRRYLENSGTEWTDFPKDKNRRPTYKFRRYLFTLHTAGEISSSYANRIIRSVIRFYKHLVKSKYLVLENPPWDEKTVTIFFGTKEGQRHSKELASTDLPLKESRSKNPYDDRIEDGGKIRPLPKKEQHALITVLRQLRNTEMTLMHVSSLSTGVRIQTVSTLRKGHFLTPPSKIRRDYIPIPAGPLTGIDTKRNKRGIIVMPKWLYVSLYTYLQSDRWKHRASKSPLGYSIDQFLFLSQRGQSFYDTQEDIIAGRLREDLRSVKTGQGIRAFMTNRVIPAMRKILEDQDFTYQFHDLRGTYGLNYLEFNQPRIADGSTSREKVLQDLAQLLWHDSTEITERYIKYRESTNWAREANDGWFAHLEDLASQAMAT